MKIAICDDEMEFANIMQKELHNLEKQLNEKIETVLFKNGEELLETFSISSFDLFFFKVCKSINVKDAADEYVVFISKIEDDSVNPVLFKSFGKLKKDRIKLDLILLIKKAYIFLKENKQNFILFKTDTEIVRCKKPEIVYCTVLDRKIQIYIKDGNRFDIRSTIKKMMSTLNDIHFLKINSGTIVNVAFIKGVSNKEVVMDNGDILSLSRSNSKNVRNAVKAYWGYNAD